MEYKPRTGVNAGKRNLKEIKEYLTEHPDLTGIQIAKDLNLSLATVYTHLKKLLPKEE